MRRPADVASLPPDDARERLVQAAIPLFRERAPGRVTVREIAAAAGVNHGLVHRHFGGKPGLVREVMRRVLRETASTARGRMPEGLTSAVADALQVLLRERWVVIVLAELALAEDPGSMEGLPPTSMAPVLSKVLGEELDAEVLRAVAVAECATLGLLLFGPLVARGVGWSPGRTEEEVTRGLTALLATALAGTASPP